MTIDRRHCLRCSQARRRWRGQAGLSDPESGLKGEALYYQLGDVTLDASPVIAASPVAIAVPPFLAVNAGQALIANKPATRVSYDGVIVRAGVSYHF